ncbi:MAG: C25 family cysteine peptidase, partial [Candidatus Zixiibacteriota bacterium]
MSRSDSNDIDIISSNADELSFTVHFPSDLTNCSRSATDDGKIRLTKPIIVGVPPGASVSLIDFKTSRLIPLDPSLSAYADSVPDGSTVEISEIHFIRSRPLVTVRVNPVVGSQVLSDISITLRFTGGDKTASGISDPVFDRIMRATVLNWKESRRWSVPRQPMAAGSGADQSVLGDASQWFKITTNETGMCRLTATELSSSGVDISSLSSSSIRMFSGGGLPLPIENQPQLPNLTEIALSIQDGGDGSFDTSDNLLFFCESLSRFSYQAGAGPIYTDNRHTTQNVYWLTTTYQGGGVPSRMATIDGSPTAPSDTNITSFIRRVRVQQDHVLHFSDGEIEDYTNWFWTDQASLSFSLFTPSAVVGDSARIILRGAVASPYIDMQINGSAVLGKSCNRFGCNYWTESLKDGLNDVTLALFAGASEQPYFDYLQAEYTSRLQAQAGKLDIALDPFSGIALLEIVDDFSAQPLVVDLADPLKPSLVTGFERSAGLLSMQVEMELDGVNRFYLCDQSSLVTAQSITESPVTDLREVAGQVDMFLITPRRFVAAVDEYVSYRRADGYSISVITVEDIMDNFGFGLYDPVAIRDFLRFAYTNYSSPPPSAVLFVGDGSHDYLDHLGTGVPNLVPPMIVNINGVSSVSDDNYVSFGPRGILDSDTSYIQGDRGFDMMTARWSVRNAAEIKIICDKIKRYEQPSSFGQWRTEVALVADDEFARRNGRDIDWETFHGIQSEELELYHLPSQFIRNKVYLWEFPFVNREKPTVNDAIVRAFNNGALLVNYVGHGSPDLWAHEHVFTRAGDLPRLTNSDRLPLIVAASCAIGFYDDPQREGMAEDLLAMSGGGAVAVLSATRLVYAQPNSDFNKAVFDFLFSDDTLTMCEAVYAAKLKRQYKNNSYPSEEINDRAYLFFGDPLMYLAAPTMNIELTDRPDSLTALGRNRISGQVVSDDGNIIAESGTLFVEVFDSDRQLSHRPANNVGNDIVYAVSGSAIFRGTASITAGTFDFEFVTPLDVSYGGQRARILVYGIQSGRDMMAVVDSIPITGTVNSALDTVGPQITFAVVGRSGFSDGGIVNTADQLTFTIADSSGINLAGGLGHGITLTIDGQTDTQKQLTSLFEYNQDD